jgi:type I restriction enzyme S subunit
MRSYPKYKLSGVEWLGKIPNNWNVAKLKYLGKTLIGVTYSPLDIVDESNGILVLRSSNIQNGKADYNSCVYLRTKISDELITRKGDILLCARNGSVELVGKNICIDETSEGFTFGAFMTIYRSKYWRFFSYFFNSEIFKAQSGLFSTSTINQLTNDTLRTMKVAFPSTIEEQQKIVDFLDYKTGECDRFISNRQKQIELLNEQKVTIINKAVTKGINPTAKMKPSGIEWIGDIPENWKVSKVKFVATVKGRIGFRGYTVDDLVDEGKGALTLGATQINKEGEIDLAKSVFISWDKYYESPEIIVQEGDILVVQRGSTIGASGIVSSNIGCATINPSLTILKRVKMNRYLLFLQLRSKIVKEAITTIFNETAIPMLSQNQISNFNVLLPPNEEDQQSIIDFIKQETLKIETLISKYQKQIELMKEYRTALISQAVTGKIDVRDWQPK